MIQTIHLINVTKKKKKILVTANIEFDTLQTEEDVQNAFEEVLPKALKVTQKNRIKLQLIFYRLQWRW